MSEQNSFHSDLDQLEARFKERHDTAITNMISQFYAGAVFGVRLARRLARGDRTVIAGAPVTANKDAPLIAG